MSKVWCPPLTFIMVSRRSPCMHDREMRVFQEGEGRLKLEKNSSKYFMIVFKKKHGEGTEHLADSLTPLSGRCTSRVSYFKYNFRYL